MLDWFDAGSRVLEGGRTPELFPPLDDAQAQRVWLAGFAGAWAEGGSDEAAEDALVAALGGRPTLLRQLWELGPGKIARRWS
ncbi:hypothetical protein ThimaDRAFT_4498 [Thiocapsa marina 5811]|uniref:Uncharacterized protein n=2 Tax=Thiocapsa marina TaxID=244573 RepID=F9UHU5_9GAMM|nr:hypothetical protein ThimaDRAFT_4498 [Thiocapsa marina 5811]